MQEIEFGPRINCGLQYLAIVRRNVFAELTCIEPVALTTVGRKEQPGCPQLNAVGCELGQAFRYCPKPCTCRTGVFAKMVCDRLETRIAEVQSARHVVVGRREWIEHGHDDHALLPYGV